MGVYKRAKWYWIHDFVDGLEYRMALKARNWHEALKRHKEKLSAAGKAAKHSGRPQLPDGEVKPSALYQRARRQS